MRVLGVRMVSGAGWAIDRAHSKRAKARQSGLRMMGGRDGSGAGAVPAPVVPRCRLPSQERLGVWSRPLMVHYPCRKEPKRKFKTYPIGRSEEHTSELQSLMRISYAVFCLKKKNTTHK